MNAFFKNFTFCPACGNKYGKNDLNIRQTVLTCNGCAFQFWQNSKPAVGLLIPKKGDPSQLLITRRAIGPHIGKLDVVGGFMGFGEEPTRAAAREAREELGRPVKIGHLFHIDRERYVYRGTPYSVLVLYYLAAPLAKAPATTDAAEIRDCFFIKASTAARSKDMAFGSDRRAISKYLKCI